jgi:hypothetical protein
MRKLTKITLAILTSFAMISTVVSAGEFTVTGGVKGTYSIKSGDSTSAAMEAGKGLGLTNEFTLGASGELDNGMTWNYAQDIDGATVQDDAKLTMTTDYGTIGLFISEGSLSQKYKFDSSAYGIGSDTGYGGGDTSSGATANTMQYGTNMSSYNNIQYHLPSGIIPAGGTFKIGYSPNGNSVANASGNAGGAQTTITGVTEAALTFAPTDALYIGASYFERQETTTIGQKQESGSLVTKYTQGPVSVGVGLTRVASQKSVSANADYTQGYDNRAASLGYAINDDLSVSFAREKSKKAVRKKTTAAFVKTSSNVEMEIDTIQAAYTMGGMTISVSNKSVDNDSYTLDKKTKETLLALAMAF